MRDAANDAKTSPNNAETMECDDDSDIESDTSKKVNIDNFDEASDYAVGETITNDVVERLKRILSNALRYMFRRLSFRGNGEHSDENRSGDRRDDQTHVSYADSRFENFARLPRVAQLAVFSYLDRKDLISARSATALCKWLADASLSRRYSEGRKELVANYPWCKDKIRFYSSLLGNARVLRVYFSERGATNDGVQTVGNTGDVGAKDYALVARDLREIMQLVGRSNRRVETVCLLRLNCDDDADYRATDDETIDSERNGGNSLRLRVFGELITKTIFDNIIGIDSLELSGRLSNAFVAVILRSPLARKLRSLSLVFDNPIDLNSWRRPTASITATNDGGDQRRATSDESPCLSLLQHCVSLESLKVTYADPRCVDYFPDLMLRVTRLVFKNSAIVRDDQAVYGQWRYIDASAFAARFVNVKTLKLYGYAIANVASIAAHSRHLTRLTLAVDSPRLTAFTSVATSNDTPDDAAAATNGTVKASSVTHLTVKHPLATSKLLCTLTCHLTEGLNFSLPTNGVGIRAATYDLFCALKFPYLRCLKLVAADVNADVDVATNDPNSNLPPISTTCPEERRDYNFNSCTFFFIRADLVSRDLFRTHLECDSIFCATLVSEDLFLRVVHFFVFSSTENRPNINSARAIFSSSDSAYHRFVPWVSVAMWKSGWDKRKKQMDRFNKYVLREVCNKDGDRNRNRDDADLANNFVTDDDADAGDAGTDLDGDADDTDADVDADADDAVTLSKPFHLHVVISDEKHRWGNNANTFIFAILERLYYRCRNSFRPLALEICRRKRYRRRRRGVIKAADELASLLRNREQTRILKNLASKHKLEKGVEKYCVACDTFDNLIDFYESKSLLALISANAPEYNADILEAELQQEQEQQPHDQQNTNPVFKFYRRKFVLGRIALFAKLFASITVENEDPNTANEESANNERSHVDTRTEPTVTYVIYVKP